MSSERALIDQRVGALRSIHVEVVKEKSQLVDPMNGEFFEWWSQVNNGLCPFRCQFDITEHPKWASRIFVIGVEDHDPLVYRYHLVGQDTIDLLGHNNSGRYLSETN